MNSIPQCNILEFPDLLGEGQLIKFSLGGSWISIINFHCGNVAIMPY